MTLQQHHKKRKTRISNTNIDKPQLTDVSNFSNPALQQLEMTFLKTTEKTIDCLKEFLSDLEKARRDFLSFDKENLFVKGNENPKKSQSLFFEIQDSLPNHFRKQLQSLIQRASSLLKSYNQNTNLEVAMGDPTRKISKDGSLNNSNFLNLAEGSIHIGENASSGQISVENFRSELEAQKDQTLFIQDERIIPIFADDNINTALCEQQGKLFQDISPIHLVNENATFSQSSHFLSNAGNLQISKVEEEVEVNVNNTFLNANIESMNESSPKQKHHDSQAEQKNSCSMEKEMSTEFSIEFEAADVEAEMEKHSSTDSPFLKYQNMILTDLDN